MAAAGPSAVFPSSRGPSRSSRFPRALRGPSRQVRADRVGRGAAPALSPAPARPHPPGRRGNGQGEALYWGCRRVYRSPEGARSRRPPHGAGPRRDPRRRAAPRGPPGVRRRRSGPSHSPRRPRPLRPASLPVVTRPPAMAAAGGARLLRAASAALGGAARRWRLVAGPRAAPGRGGGAGGLPRTLSVSAPARSSSEDKITVHFVNRDGETLTAKGKVGDSLLDVVIENNLDIDGFGACEGTLACSTCHLIFEEHIFEKLDAVTDEENDMLDLAYGLTDRSRLGCQIYLTKAMDNMTVRVPEAVADARQAVDMGKNS